MQDQIIVVTTPPNEHEAAITKRLEVILMAGGWKIKSARLAVTADHLGDVSSITSQIILEKTAE